MIHKLRGLFKTLLYRSWYGKRINVDGYLQMEKDARINLKDGTVSIGRGCYMKPNSYLAVTSGGRLTIGDNVSIARNCIVVCHDRIKIGNRCAFGPNVLIYDHDHKFGHGGIKPGYNTTPVTIDDNCWIGAGVTILRGTHIGEGSVIGAGCVVTGEIPPHSLVKADRMLSITHIEHR